MILMLSIMALFAISSSLGDESADEPPELDFRDEVSQAAFLRGWNEFREGNFKAAEKSFGEADKGVLSQDRKVLATWRKASKDGHKLLAARERFEAGKTRAALKDLDKLEKKAGDGPLKPHLVALRAKIEETLFVIIDDFENQTPSGEIGRRNADGRYGYQNLNINTNLKYVRSGKQSLVWQTMAAGYNPDGVEILIGEITKFKDSQLDEFPYLSFSVHTERPGEFELFMYPRQRSAVDEDDYNAVPGLHRFSAKRAGWLEVRIDLKRALRKPAVRTKPEGRYRQVLRIRMLRPANSQRVYFDRVRFERK